ncbi:MAG TPA: DMT family transporter [Candidatus Acidoferrales bacterium]|nr:DMT family transporter [Candidatus Acidoferrales bacterium]
MNARFRPFVYAALLYVVSAWSINHIFVKQVLEQMNPLAFALLRFVVMVPLAFVLVWISGGRIHIERRDIPALLACGACGYGIYQYLWVLGLANTTPFATALLGSTSPIFTLAIVAVAGHEHVRTGRWIGAALALLGVAIFEGAFSGEAALRIGDMLVLGAAVVFAGYNVIGARLLARYTPLELLAITMTIGAIFLIPGGTGALLHTNLAALGWGVWWRIIYAMLFPILLTYPVWTWGLNAVGSGKGSIAQFLLPILTGVLSVPILHATFAAYQIIGTIVCLGGMFFAFALGRKRPLTLADRDIRVTSAP